MAKVSVVKCEKYDLDKVYSSIKDSLKNINFTIPKGKTVLLKPNVLGQYTPQMNITTNPVFVEAVCKILKENKCKIIIGDSSAAGSYETGGTDKAFRMCGLQQVADRYKAKLVNFEASNKIKITDQKAKIYKEQIIASEIKEADLIINLPKLKTHTFIQYTGAVKNLFGTVPGAGKPQLHRLGHDVNGFAEILVDIYQNILPSLNIMDGIIGIEGNGPGREGKIKQAGLIFASANAVALDFVASECIGFVPMEILTNKKAVERGLFDRKIELIGEKTKVGFEKPASTAGVNFLIKKSPARPVCNHDKCLRCGRCAKLCPAGAITYNPFPVFDYKKCIRCFCCHENCPAAAIKIQKTFIGKMLSEEKKHDKDYQKKCIEEILSQFEEKFLIKLAFFYYDRSDSEIPFIEHKLDNIIKQPDLALLLRQLDATYMKHYTKNLEYIIKFWFLKKYTNKRIWNYILFLHMNKIVHEIQQLTGAFAPYIIEYVVVRGKDKKDYERYLKSVSAIFKNNFEQLASSKTAIKKQDYAKHPFADYNTLRKKYSEPPTQAVIALYKKKAVGFAMGWMLNLGKSFSNIGEIGGFIVDPKFRGYGIAENIATLGKKMTEEQKSVDYVVSIINTINPYSLYINEGMHLRPFLFEIGGYEDFNGYTEPGFGSCDYSNYIFYINDSKRYIRDSSMIAFCRPHQYLAFRFTYHLLKNYRHVVVVDDKRLLSLPESKISIIQAELALIKKQGFGSYFVNITLQDSVAVMEYLEKNNFYFCGILPMASLEGDIKTDYAYYRYLDENKTTYPYICTSYKHVGTRYGFLVNQLKLRAIKEFNNSRTLNKIPDTKKGQKIR